MSSNSSTRIPVKPEEFFPYMQSTDNHQLSDDPANPGHSLSEKWTWTPVESAAWTEFRNRADALFPIFSDPKFKNTDVKDQVITLIKEVQEYDHGKLTGHHLLNLVAQKGTITDCEKFHVKRDTVLADSNPTAAAALGLLSPTVTIRSTSPGEHELTVTNPATPDSKALPEGVRFANVYRYIGASNKPPASMDDYKFIGVAKRGLFISHFDEETFDRDTKYFAWYFGRYVSNSGELGSPGEPAIAMVLEAGHVVVNHV